MTSRRLPGTASPNAWTCALEARRRSGVVLLDLTEANPTRVGLGGAAWETLAALSDTRALDYAPDPRGLPEARAAVARYYAERGAEVDPDHVVLTAGTSEAYAHLFRLLGDPGDAFVAPRPSYPLFDPLARLEGVELVHHALRRHPAAGGRPPRWGLDPECLERAITPRTRAVIAVEPGHPTGACLDPFDRQRLEATCARHGLAIFVDEVFGDFRWPSGPLTDPGVDGGAALPSFVGPRTAPTFVLSGLSKVCGMPQMKLSWIVVGGPPGARDEALRGLEWISDLFLSVSVPVQVALPALLEARHSFQARVHERLAANLERLAAAARRAPGIEPLPAQGGWVAVLRLPPVRNDEAWAIALLERDVAVHPGYFYDFEDGNVVVVSLIVPPAEFDEALTRIETQVARG